MASPHKTPSYNRPGALSALIAFSDTIRAGVRITQPPDPARRRARTPPPRSPSQTLSAFSSSAIPDSGWCSPNFALGAGMVIIQPATHRVVVLYSPSETDGQWFFPRGRKDIGESLQQAALREAHEESGYHPELFPVYHLTRQPPPADDPDARQRPSTEPIYTTTTFWTRTRAEYLTFWYVGRIAEDAVPKDKKLSPSELDYTTHLLTYKEALARVWGQQKAVLEYAWAVYIYTQGIEGEQISTGTFI